MKTAMFGIALCLGNTAGHGQSMPTTVEAVKPDAPPATITVKGQRSQVRRTIDATTYDVKDSAQAQAGTAADVLNALPSVQASQDGALTVRGNGNVRLYIDGKPTSAAGGAITLQTMPGGSIASVEVMTNPSAKYDANGGAIVNLILKKDADAGVHATLTANAGDHGRANATLAGSYGDKRLSANLTASLRDDVRFTEVRNERTLADAGGAVIGRSVRDARYTPTHSKVLDIDGSLAYKLTASSDLGMDFSLAHASPKNRVFEHRVDYDPLGNIVSEYERVRGGTYFGHKTDASLYYQDRGSADRGSLKVVAQATRDSVRSDRPFLLSAVVPAGPDTAQRFYNGTFMRQQRLSIDYDHPLGKGVRFSIGSELKREALRVENGQAAISPDGVDHDPPPVATLYRVTKKTAAAYLTVEARWGKWTIQAGERGQAIKLNFNGTSGTQLSDRTITALNPSLSIARDVGSGQLTLKATRSQQLFDLRDLDPLITYIDPDSRSVGNPGLRPQEITSVEGGYSFGKGDRSGAVTLYYRHAHNTLADYSIFLPDNVEVSAKRNFGNAQSFGLEASIADQLSKTLKLGVTANAFHTAFPQISADGSGQTRSRYSYTAQINVDWKTNAVDDLHLDANAQGPTLVPQGEKSGIYAASMAWRHKVSAKLTLSLSGQSLLRRAYVRTVLDTSTGHDVGRRLNGARALFAGLKYKLD